MRTKAVILLAMMFSLSILPADGGSIRSGARTNFERAEKARIQRHLARIEAELLAADVSALTPSQRRARQERIGRLREYRLAGRFPHNHQFPGRRVPYFTDQHGTLCAMAYLIATSGGRDIVSQVTGTANNATVTALAGNAALGPALATWLEANGLTVEEAQRIQPAYEEYPIPTRISAGYATASGATGALSIATAIANFSSPGHGRKVWIPLAGLATGSAEVILGLTKLDRTTPAKTLSVINLIVGVTSIAASVSALVPSGEERSANAHTSSTGIAIAPMAGVDRAMNPVLGLRAAF
jgi:hypothetical protein